jgi:uncharacterized membrane protein YkoI
MAMNRTTCALALCLTLAAAASPTALARDSERHRNQGDERTLAEPALSLDDAVAQAERRHNARAVRAEEKRHGDRIEYRIRLLADDGRVFEVRIDAATGREN